MPWVLCALAGTAGSIGAYLLTASQVILDGLQTGIGQLYEEQRLVLARPLLGHKPVVLVRRQTILHPGGQGGHRDDFSCATAFGRIVVRLRGILVVVLQSQPVRHSTVRIQRYYRYGNNK